MADKLHRNASYKEDFFLPADYYKPVPLWISLIWIPIQWIILPILSYNPDLLDPLLSDHYEHVADDQKRNIIKLFMIMLWVSFEIQHLSLLTYQSLHKLFFCS